MSDPVSTIRNLGPATAAAFARAGIHSARELRALGADAAYLKLLQTGHPPHFIGYYALVMGLAGRPWNDCKGTEKDALKQRFEALKAKAAAMRDPAEAFEAELDRIGLGRPGVSPPDPQSISRKMKGVAGAAQPTISRPEKK